LLNFPCARFKTFAFRRKALALLIQQEFSHIHKRYWGQHFWARGYFCASIGKMTEKMISAYIENQEQKPPMKNFKIAED